MELEQTLNERYQLKEKLGQNAGRQTWLAEDLSSESKEKVIVKLLTFGGDVQWDDLKLFEREAQVLQQLNHARIPKCRDYFSIDDRTLWFGLVQQYIPGKSLKQLLTEGKRFTETEVQKVAIDLLRILLYLHQLNPPVLHRDIKPSNVIWGEDEKIYLVDFGAVQDKKAVEGATFTVVGSYGYAPMEQFGGRAVPASDLYALGATLIHLLTRTPPADLPQHNLKIQFADRVSINSNFMQWIGMLTEPFLENRFSTAFEAMEALITGEYSSTSKGASLSLRSKSNNSSGGGLLNPLVEVPAEIKSWNWGAFLAAPLWSLSNKVWLGLLCWIPYLSSVSMTWKLGYCGTKGIYLSVIPPYLILALVLGFKGNEWAWKCKKWESISVFKASQRGWTVAGLFLVSMALTYMFIETVILRPMLCNFVGSLG